MKLIYEVEVKGFDSVPHAKAFYEKWLADGGVESLFARARHLIEDPSRTRQYSSQPAHGTMPCPGWTHIGCLGAWQRGDAYSANCHCLEVFKDPQGNYYLVDQSEHGRFNGHSFNTVVLEKIPEAA